MRALISVDIEGVAGVAGREDTVAGNPEYERARRLMTAEASAAVRGVLAAEPQAEVLVADAHGTFRNVIPELLDPRARLVRGKPRLLAMIEGVESGVECALFIGYHGRAGAGESALAHTFTGALADVRVNGRSFGETALNAAVAGAFGVPVVLVTGDSSLPQEVEETVPQATVAVVKRGVGYYAVESMHPERACRLIEESAAEAVAHRSTIQPFIVDGPVALEVEVASPAVADQTMIVPGIRRVDGRTLAYDASDYLTAYRIVRLVATLSQVPV